MLTGVVAIGVAGARRPWGGAPLVLPALVVGSGAQMQPSLHVIVITKVATTGQVRLTFDEGGGYSITSPSHFNFILLSFGKSFG